MSSKARLQETIKGLRTLIGMQTESLYSLKIENQRLKMNSLERHYNVVVNERNHLVETICNLEEEKGSMFGTCRI